MYCSTKFIKIPSCNQSIHENVAVATRRMWGRGADSLSCSLAAITISTINNNLMKVGWSYDSLLQRCHKVFVAWGQSYHTYIFWQNVYRWVCITFPSWGIGTCTTNKPSTPHSTDTYIFISKSKKYQGTKQLKKH